MAFYFFTESDKLSEQRDATPNDHSYGIISPNVSTNQDMDFLNLKPVVSLNEENNRRENYVQLIIELND